MSSSLQDALSYKSLEHALHIPRGALFPSLSLSGFSRAMHATAFAIPELDLQLDAGLVVHDNRPLDIFVTHTHTDHVHALTHLKTRRKPPNIYAPAHAVPLINDFLHYSQRLTDSGRREEDFAYDHAYTLIGLEPGDRFTFERGKARYEVDVYACDHSVPCLGYGVSELRDRLLPEFEGLPGHELGRLRARGERISAPQRVPMFAFLGDTTPLVFERHPEILAHPVVITECSFLDEPELIKQADKTKHTHLSQLMPIIEGSPQVHFVLTHLSYRYKAAEIGALLAPHQRPNILWWIAELNPQLA